MPSAPETISRQLAELVLGLNYDDLPSDVIHTTKRLYLDTLACAIGGRNGEPVKDGQKHRRLSWRQPTSDNHWQYEKDFRATRHADQWRHDPVPRF